jgi:hypothetical protein
MPPSQPERSLSADGVQGRRRSLYSAERDAVADDLALHVERLRYEADGPRALAPERDVAELLEADEGVRAIEHEVMVLGRPGDGRSPLLPHPTGTFTVTSRRLLHASQPSTAIELEDVEDAAVAPGRLLLILAGGHSLVLETRRPQLLRFHISRARADRAAVRRAAAGTRPAAEARPAAGARPDA